MQHDREGAQQALLDTSGAVIRRVHSVWSGFLDFVARDNVLEVAVGLIIATSFTSLVNTLVSEVLLPPISLIPGMEHKNLPEKFWILRKGPNAGVNSTHGYNTLQQARDDGAVTMAYGLLGERALNFIGLGIVLYAIASLYGLITNDSIIKYTVRCTYCRKEISQKAKRCPMCTSWLDGREDRETSAL